MKASRIVVLLQSAVAHWGARLTLDILDAFRAETSLRIVSAEGGPLIDVARRLGPSVVLRQLGS